ncbi:MAG: ABC transporter ATP-binding protein [Bacteroidales bacterium]|nr:ABC transporter ATP-binding protein [Bacteroidales bacterium]
MEQKRAIECHDLTTGYRAKGRDILITSDINATLLTGEMTCLLGPNGAGKSTLMRTLSGFQPPLGGEILIMGKPLIDYTAAELARVIGVVLTEKLTLRNMTVEELIGMGRSPYTGFWGKLNDEDRRVVNDAIDAVGIEALRSRTIQTLSDGERQKVMIAKALAQETPIIILDEPTAFIDFPGKVDMMNLLSRLAHEKNKAIFISTHDLELALLKADQIWLLNRHRGLATGTPSDLAANGKMASYFPGIASLFDEIRTLPTIHQTKNSIPQFHG